VAQGTRARDLPTPTTTPPTLRPGPPLSKLVPARVHIPTDTRTTHTILVFELASPAPSGSIKRGRRTWWAGDVGRLDGVRAPRRGTSLLIH
jgi:hypothetical protein